MDLLDAFDIQSVTNWDVDEYFHLSFFECDLLLLSILMTCRLHIWIVGMYP